MTSPTLNPVILGTTSSRVFSTIVTSDDPPCARSLAKDLDADIGQIRGILRNLTKKHALVVPQPSTDPKNRTLYYTPSEDAIDRVEAGKKLAEERAERRASSPASVPPMEKELFEPAFRTVALYDVLITRYTGMLYRDRRDGHPDGQVRTFTLEGELFEGTPNELLSEIRERRSAITSVPSFVAALRLELSKVIALGHDEDEDESAEGGEE